MDRTAGDGTRASRNTLSPPTSPPWEDERGAEGGVKRCGEAVVKAVDDAAGVDCVVQPFPLNRLPSTAVSSAAAAAVRLSRADWIF